MSAYGHRSGTSITGRVFVLARPGSRREREFRAVLSAAGFDDGGCLSYQDLLTQGFQALERLKPGDILKIDAPGNAHTVECLLIARGAQTQPDPRITAANALALPSSPGEIRYVRLGYLGYVALLDELDVWLRSRGVHTTNPPKDIAVLFDKRATTQRLQLAGCPIPQHLTEGPIGSHTELVKAMSRAGSSSVFVKLAHSSSASGVVAYRRHLHTGQQMAITSAELVRAPDGSIRLFNNLTIQRYTNPEDIEDITNAILSENAVVEAWIPKASLDKRTVDLRLVVVGGRVRHGVVRASRSPITNLHLGNERGDIEHFIRRLGPERWRSLCEDVEHGVQNAFPQCLCVGVDVLVNNGYSKHVILEINAFGDDLPGCIHMGQSVYEAQAQALRDRYAR